MKKFLLLLSFLTISFFSYGETGIINDNAKFKITKLSQKAVATKTSELIKNWYAFEVTTSCGPVITVYDFCDCSYTQLMIMAASKGLMVNHDACPLDEPGSQHVRIIMP